MVECADARRVEWWYLLFVVEYVDIQNPRRLAELASFCRTMGRDARQGEIGPVIGAGYLAELSPPTFCTFPREFSSFRWQGGGAAPSHPRAVERGTPRSVATVTVPSALDETPKPVVVALLRAGRGRHGNDHWPFPCASRNPNSLAESRIEATLRGA